MKRSFGARAAAYLLLVFVVGTYDRTGKPDAMVAAWEVSVHQIRQVLHYRYVRPDISTGT